MIVNNVAPKTKYKSNILLLQEKNKNIHKPIQQRKQKNVQKLQNFL